MRASGYIRLSKVPGRIWRWICHIYHVFHLLQIELMMIMLIRLVLLFMLEDDVDDDDGDGEEDEHAQAMDFLFFMEMPFASGESFSFLNFLFSIEGTVYLKPGR